MKRFVIAAALAVLSTPAMADKPPALITTFMPEECFAQGATCEIHASRGSQGIAVWIEPHQKATLDENTTPQQPSCSWPHPGDICVVASTMTLECKHP
jgi:hypothetical protein